MLFWLNKTKWTLIFLTILSVLICLFTKRIISLEVFGSATAGWLAAFISVLKQTIEDDRVFKELFISFNSRYDQEMNDVFNKLRKAEASGFGSDLDEKEEFLIFDYFNLSSEEYLWYSKGRIPGKVWRAWECGIIENLSLKKVRELFENDTKTERQAMSYYGFVGYIKPKLR